MRIQKQKFKHDPENKIYGDCFRTAIAVILDLDRDDVPHFNEGAHWDDGKQMDRAREWLKERGLTLISVAYKMPLNHVLETMHNINPGIPFLLAGKSATGNNHQVVAVNGAIACDPSLTDAGIIGPCDDGFYWIDFVGKLLPV